MADTPTPKKPGAPEAKKPAAASAATPSSGQSPTTKQPQQPAAQQQQRLEVDDKNAVCCYANFCRVTHTPEELIVDFGLNWQSPPDASQPIEVKQRIVLNYYTSKRLLQALTMSVQRYEQAFGVLETDVQKRVIGGRPQANG